MSNVLPRENSLLPRLIKDFFEKSSDGGFSKPAGPAVATDGHHLFLARWHVHCKFAVSRCAETMLELLLTDLYGCVHARLAEVECAVVLTAVINPNHRASAVGFDPGNTTPAQLMTC
ncbi:MAG: hypothetical protein NTV46_13995 [Verrucomicrobia bacterium]|nr:hypothetical protein [Verrucomicrobiota bacterium]